MTTPYLITGLPRSRTAWLSVAATGPESLCHHEITQHLPDWWDIFPFWRNAPRRFTGFADHGLGFHLPEIIARAGPRVLVVERPIREVEASLVRLGFPATNFCTLLLAALAYEHPNIRRASYGLLSSTGAVVDCLEWLMPGARIDAERIDLLQSMNIQADVEAAKRAAQEPGVAARMVGSDVMAKMRLL